MDRPKDTRPEQGALPVSWTGQLRPVQSELPLDPPPAPQPPPRRRPPLLLPFLTGTLGALLGIGAVLFIDSLTSDPEPQITERVVTEIVTPTNVAVGSQASAVARRVVPSVAAIEVSDFFSNGSGSGVVYDAQAGYIVTNEHVVLDEDNVDVVLFDGRRYEASVLGTDKLTDLAVLQISGVGLTEIEKGSSLGLAVGDPAIAVGNPLGLAGGPTVTVGVLSAFDRFVAGQTERDDLWGMIQTDAPFQRGSSGGALVDMEGRLIGITTAVGVSDLGPEGVGFATPVEVVDRVVTEIIATGESGHAFLGIQGTTAFEPIGDGGEAPIGVLVSLLLDNSAAGENGVRAGDTITRFEGEPVLTMDQLISRLRRYSPEDEIELEVQRGTETFTVSFAAGERPPEAEG